MKFLSFLILAPALYGNTISFTAFRNTPISPTSAHDLSVSAIATIPQFDQSLGTLDSIDFRFSVGGWLTWQQLAQPYVGMTLDFSVTTQLTLFGAVGSHAEGTVYGYAGAGYSGDGRCGIPEFPLCFFPGRSKISNNGGVFMSGTILDGASTAAMPLQGPHSNVVGKPVSSLDQFLGTSSFDLPYSFAINAVPQEPFGVYVGGLLGPQVLPTNIFWTYNYTPVPLIESFSATSIYAAPEPRLIGLICWILAAAMIGAGLCGLSLAYSIAKDYFRGIY